MFSIILQSQFTNNLQINFNPLIPLSFCQTKGKLWGGLEFVYGLGLSDGLRKTEYYSSAYSSGGYALNDKKVNALLGYYLRPNLSLGIGIGSYGYNNPMVGFFPLFAHVRFHPLRANHDLELGDSLGGSIIELKGELPYGFKGSNALTASFSVGYKILNLWKIKVVPSVAYDYLNYSTGGFFPSSSKGEYNKHERWSRHSIDLRLGFYF